MPPRGRAGFTLIELMIVVAIIGILASVAIPKMVGLLDKTKVARTAADLNTMAKGFHNYAVQNEGAANSGYPDDTDLVLPAGLEAYFEERVFLGSTPMGGRYNWDGPDFYPYAGLAIQDITVDEALLVQVDAKLDDGVLATGSFQKTANGRYTYMLWRP